MVVLLTPETKNSVIGGNLIFPLIRQVFTHLVRDWTKEGAETR
jgi:hypothetical protein